MIVNELNYFLVFVFVVVGCFVLVLVFGVVLIFNSFILNIRVELVGMSGILDFL